MTLAPHESSFLAIALPIPRPAPVTRAVFPSSVKGIPTVVRQPTLGDHGSHKGTTWFRIGILHCSIIIAAAHKCPDAGFENSLLLDFLGQL